MEHGELGNPPDGDGDAGFDDRRNHEHAVASELADRYVPGLLAELTNFHGYLSGSEEWRYAASVMFGYPARWPILASMVESLRTVPFPATGFEQLYNQSRPYFDQRWSQAREMIFSPRSDSESTLNTAIAKHVLDFFRWFQGQLDEFADALIAQAPGMQERIGRGSEMAQMSEFVLGMHDPVK